jgi:transketolase
MNLSKELATVLRMLSVDAVDKAQSGHPGMPLGMADIATVLWQKWLKHNPKNPHWFNRDRFILSNGHGSMLLYALLHVSGYALAIDDLKQFRQLNSKTPGHPEWEHTPGVETTSGPLGQGLANAVGMALAEQILACQFNKPRFPVVDHYTYAFVGDGCLMEGISHEACSLAGTLGLGKLIVFYDDNGISIDGAVDAWFRDDTALRFKAYHWHVVEGVDGHDFESIDRAISEAHQNTTQPSLIICKTTIGLGTSVAGSEQAHGSPLGKEDIATLRRDLNWPYPPFEVPSNLYEEWDHTAAGNKAETAWLNLLRDYQGEFPAKQAEFLRRINGDLPDNWQSLSQEFFNKCLHSTKEQATRKASQQCIEFFASHLPEMLGGSADLTGSNNTDWTGSKVLNHGDFTGNYLHYGVREFGMAAIMNGLALHGGFIPYGGTFLVFADYARNAIRLSALMQQRVIYVFSHDSIGLGEDGPTHQPVEHIAMLRMTPGMTLWRPADLLETALAWQFALSHHSGPTALLLTRQNVPALAHEAVHIEHIKKGGYVLWDSGQPLNALLLATGSEVHLALAAAERAKERGISVRVVSLPSVEVFQKQDPAYINQVLPPEVKLRIAVEAGSSAYWYKWVGLEGAVIGLDRYGVSAPGKEAYQFLGITVESILNALDILINKHRCESPSLTPIIGE